MSNLHTLFITHTHERIARTLMGMRSQTRPPDTITVACDSDDERIEPEIRRASGALKIPILLVLRKPSDVACRSQNRNNALRALQTTGIGDNDHLIFYDGDCIACPESNEVHYHALERFDLSLGWATRLSGAQTASLTDEQILAGQTHLLLDDQQVRSSASAHLKTRKRIALKKIGLTKPHKPGIFSGNFGVRLGAIQAVNGFDESFTGWGMEDDDLARRLYMIGARPKSVMDRAVVFHQDHPTQEPANWNDSPNAHRLSQPTLARCQQGIENPAPQHEPRLIEIRPVHSC